MTNTFQKIKTMDAGKKKQRYHEATDRHFTANTQISSVESEV